MTVASLTNNLMLPATATTLQLPEHYTFTSIELHTYNSIELDSSTFGSCLLNSKPSRKMSSTTEGPVCTIASPSKQSMVNVSADVSTLQDPAPAPPTGRRPSHGSLVPPLPDLRGGGDAGGAEAKSDASFADRQSFDRSRRRSMRPSQASHSYAVSGSLLEPLGMSKDSSYARDVSGRRATSHHPSGSQRPTLPSVDYGQRRLSRQRRPRHPGGRQARSLVQERYRDAMAVTHAVAHWRWRAQPHRHLTTGGDPDRELPDSMQPELPAHSRWLWNAKDGDLFWQTEPDNPVEIFYQTSLGEEAIKRQIGLFGKRFKSYPNAATIAVPEPGRHLFARAVSKVVDRDGHAVEGKVNIDDVKAVAEAAVGQFYPTAFGRRRFSEMPNVNHFLLSLIEYFHHYFKERKMSELTQQHNCMVFDEAGIAERRVRMKDCLLEASRCYAIFILGRGMPFHHTNEGAFGTISASSADRQFWEALYAFTIQVVWITFGRPNCTVILREMGRIFRTLYLDPARREAERSTGKYINAARRRDALLGQMPNKMATREGRSGKPLSRADELASHNYLAMCVAMARVFGVYDCPPMPPKPIYSLLKNRSAFVDGLLAEDPHRRHNTRHVVERTSIGILGHPRSEFDDNLDPIDLQREAKFRQLKFLGPITERTEQTRIASVTPYLLLPTLPSASDLEKYT